MRKIALLSAAVLLLAAGCSVEELRPDIAKDVQKITIQATIADEGPVTKSVRLANGAIWWTPGDEISVFYGSGTAGGSRFTSQATENSRVTNFTGTIGVITGGGEISMDETFFWGIYPYNETATCDGSTVVTDVPSTQTAVPGTFAPGTYPWIGKSQGLMMTFYGLCGGIKFTVNKEGIKRATLKTQDGSAIAGRVRIAVDDNGIPSVQEEIDGSDEIVLEAPAGQYFIPGESYFFVTLPHVFTTSFYTIKFETFTEEGTYERKRAQEIKRADFISFSSALDGNVTYEKKTGNIPVEDASFKSYLVANYDTDTDGEISFEEAEDITEIVMLPSNDYNLQSLKGIEYMPNLQTIDCWGDWYDSGKKSDGIDKPYYYVGPYSECWDPAWGPIGTLKYIDVTNNPSLVKLNLCNNSALGVELGTIDVSRNPLLKELELAMTWLEYPDISSNAELEIINFGHLRGTVPDLSALTKVKWLNMDYPQEMGHEYIDLSVSHMPDLEYLNVCERIRSLSDLSANQKLKELHISYLPEFSSTLDVSSNTDLEVLVCREINLSSLDVSHNPNLISLDYMGNNITSIDLSNNTALKELKCRGNGITELNLEYNTELEVLDCAENQLAGIDISALTNLVTLYADKNPYTGIDVSHNESLVYLDCSNSNVSALDVSHNPNLEVLFCHDTQITSLILNNNVSLVQLYCNDNRLTSLDLSKNTGLKCIDCRNNLLTSLNVSKNLLLGEGEWHEYRQGLYCSPMNDGDGNNLLSVLYIAENQTIPFVTQDRSNEHIPEGTTIMIAPPDGGGEGSSETTDEP